MVQRKVQRPERRNQGVRQAASVTQITVRVSYESRSKGFYQIRIRPRGFIEAAVPPVRPMSASSPTTSRTTNQGIPISVLHAVLSRTDAQLEAELKRAHLGPTASMDSRGLTLSCSGSWTGSIEVNSLNETVGVLHGKICAAAGIAPGDEGGGVKLISGGRNLMVIPSRTPIGIRFYDTVSLTYFIRPIGALLCVPDWCVAVPDAQDVRPAGCPQDAVRVWCERQQPHPRLAAGHGRPEKGPGRCHR